MTPRVLLVVAVQLTTGERLWYAPLADAGRELWNAAAATAIPGVTIADGMLFAGSGYGFGATDTPGNVLLAFAAE